MREKWWYLEFFWSVFSLIRTEYRPKKLLNTDTLYTVIKSFIKVSGLEKLPVQQIWKTQRFLRETYVFLTSSVHIWGMQPLLRESCNILLKSNDITMVVSLVPVKLIPKNLVP